ncbi:protein ripply2 [Camelus bactrianus]|uniref:Protein ripply2 n=1 Tax=Camelus bactrianus TaxID=9837 RepID=A0AC58QRZ0_CAMBA
MEIPESTESRAGQCARRRRQPPAAPDRPTRRGGADSGYRASAPPCASPTPSLLSAPPQLLPSALRPLHPPGPRSAAVGSYGSGLTSLLRALCSPPRRSAGFWRPWVDDRGEKAEEAPQQAAQAIPDGPGITDALGKLSRYKHPVRLFWPKSKCCDYLYQEAEALLKNFPIQATISIYEDSDSEEEIEELICEN